MLKHRATSFIRRLVNSRSSAPASFIEVERAERLFYLGYLREGMTVFDVGANIGELTMLFSRFVGVAGRVHAFEPSSAIYARLGAICAAASLRNVQLNQLGLAEKEGPVILHFYGDDYLSWTSQALRPLESYGIDVRPVSTEEAAATTVDLYCNRNHISAIDLLKVDVEGAEFQVLLGAREMLQAHRVKCIVFEFGQTTFDMNNHPDDIEAYLEGLGYVLRNIVGRDPVFPGRESVQSACFSMHVATIAGAQFK